MFCMVGLNCCDIVSFVHTYPLEDSDQRCLAQSWERGGNASNNASVLVELGVKVEYFGTLANDILLSFFQDDMNARGIKCDNCPIIDDYKAPASVIICCEDTGSRTIVHHNGGLPELTLEQFQEKLDLKSYDWIHFEGRNVAELKKILIYLQQYNDQHNQRLDGTETKTGPNFLRRLLPVSVELEKYRGELAELLPLADVVFVGKEFAVLKGAADCAHAAQLISKLLPKGVLLICAWGDQGASFCVTGDRDAAVTKVDAFPPEKIVDSIGAGDTFVASVIYALRKKVDLETSVRFGCKIASKKLTICGFKGISELAKNEPELLQ